MATEKSIYINAPFPEGTHEEIRERAFREKKSKGQLVVELATAKLNEEPKKPEEEAKP